MPLSSFPAAYASEAARTLRQLARLGELDRTGTTAPAVISDLRATAISIRQVVDQLAFAHTDPGLPAGARGDALATADELHQAGTVLDELAARLATAEDAAEQVMSGDTGPVREWVAVASLHGDQAAEALRLLEEEGPEGAVVFCSQWDAGIDTDDEAIEGRRTRASVPLAAGDQAVTVDAYTLVANRSAGHVAMYRLIGDLPSMAIIEAQDRLDQPQSAPFAQAPTAPVTRRAAREQTEARRARPPSPRGSWFEPPTPGGGTEHGRGRSL